MDGVTDAAFRTVTARIGKPDLIVTEFTSAEGISAGALRLLDDFEYSEIERPVVAQLFGADPAAFFTASVVASALGFDGIDINMGCPAKNVTQHGAGAALIRDPARALEIVRQSKAGTRAWNESRNIDDFDVSAPIKAEIARRRALLTSLPDSEELPVSVKTRIGYDSVVIGPWTSELLTSEPAALTVHGRTLKQLYGGQADWEAIREAASLIRQTETKALGNGDVPSRAAALEKCAEYGVDGVLIGRATFGNPWLFIEHEATLTERLQMALEHSRIFAGIFPPQAFVRMRKHLLDYIKGFEGAKEIRIKLMKVSSLEEVEAILMAQLG
jgi:tRNA-dihydrouridine synthase